MKPSSSLPVFLRPAALLVTFAGVTAKAGDFAAAILGGDADSGINTGLTYTAKVDFNGAATTINGVGFTDTGASGTGYTLTGAGGAFSGYSNTVTGALNAASSNFFYTSDGTGNASVTLTGLTPGTKYVTSWYNTAFGSNRYVDITANDTGTTFRYNEDAGILGGGNVLRYAFTATGTSITYAFDAVSNGDSFHHYAMTNAVRNDAVFSYTHFTPAAPVVTRVSASTTPFTVSNTDLLQTHLSGIVTTGNFNREPVLGATSVLANGAFSITGVGANNPELVTGENNAIVTFNLDTTFSPSGYDISSVAGYGGWNDGGRDEQKYSVYFSQVGSPTFNLYGQLDDNPAAAGSPSAVKAVFSGNVSNVNAIRIVFLDAQENGFAGYGEFDVFGNASVPEPGAAGLLLIGTAGLLSRRRRQG